MSFTEFVDRPRTNGKAHDKAADGEAKAGLASRFITAAELQGWPVLERESLVTDWIPMSTVTILGGDGGTGKSVIALQLAAAVALGHRWLGMPVREGRAVFISAEDDLDELHRRLSAITTAESVELSNLDRLMIRSLAGEDALLARLDAHGGTLVPTALFAEVDHVLRENAPSLLVLDTLADLFPGNENDRAQARQFIGMLRGLALRHRAAVVVLAHPSLSGLNSGSGTSGSTAWNNSVRSRLYLERIADQAFESDPDLRRLSVKKANYARVGTEVLVKWHDGVFQVKDGATGVERHIAANKAERVFLKLLASFDAQERYVSAQPSSAYAPTIFAGLPEAEGVSKRALLGAMNSLFASGKIKMGKLGPNSRSRSYIALAERAVDATEGEE